jgi:hypothetical protein
MTAPDTASGVVSTTWLGQPMSPGPIPDFDTYVANLVAQAPSFTEEQRRKLSAMLAPPIALDEAS